jgi:hypothetical protein
VAALACPASAINAIDGQAVFLVAALIVGGFMIWLLPMLSPPLISPVARIAPRFPVLLIVLLFRPGVSASVHGR